MINSTRNLARQCCPYAFQMQSEIQQQKSELKSQQPIHIDLLTKAIASNVARLISLKKFTGIFPFATLLNFSASWSITWLKWPTNVIRTLLNYEFFFNFYSYSSNLKWIFRKLLSMKSRIKDCSTISPSLIVHVLKKII